MERTAGVIIVLPGKNSTTFWQLFLILYKRYPSQNLMVKLNSNLAKLSIHKDFASIKKRLPCFLRGYYKRLFECFGIARAFSGFLRYGKGDYYPGKFPFVAFNAKFSAMSANNAMTNA